MRGGADWVREGAGCVRGKSHRHTGGAAAPAWNIIAQMFWFHKSKMENDPDDFIIQLPVITTEKEQDK
jgi:hypothetical protein